MTWVVKRWGDRYLAAWQYGPPLECAAWVADQSRAHKFTRRIEARVQAEHWRGRVVRLRTPQATERK